MLDTQRSGKPAVKWIAFGGVALLALAGAGAGGFMLGQASSSPAPPLEAVDEPALAVGEPVAQSSSESGRVRKIGAWDYREARDAFTDKVSAMISVTGEQSILAVKCDEPGSIYVIVYPGEYIGGGAYETRTVLVRRDNDAAEEQRWRHDDDYAAIFDDDEALEFADSLVGVDRLAVRVRDYQFNSYDKAFELGSETESALQAVYKTCEVSGPPQGKN